MLVRILEQPFDPLEELRACQTALGPRLRQIGAMASFVGSMRDFNEGVPVTSMTLEHYPGMTDSHLECICASASERWQLNEVLIVHRVGEVRPPDPIVLVATWSAHRAHAFESCRHIMEELKSTAPFWKREETVAGTRWVTSNTPGTSGTLER